MVKSRQNCLVDSGEDDCWEENSLIQKSAWQHSQKQVEDNALQDFRSGELTALSKKEWCIKKSFKHSTSLLTDLTKGAASLRTSINKSVANLTPSKQGCGASPTQIIMNLEHN